MNKADLIEAVQQDLGDNCSRAHAERCVNSVLDAISAGLCKDNSVQLVGFGTFQVRHRKARTGLNPQTREPMQIPASKTVGFRPGNKLKAAI
ncbi:MAG: HU family DNA-binding protein [Planctomycetota bacterium]